MPEGVLDAGTKHRDQHFGSHTRLSHVQTCEVLEEWSCVSVLDLNTDEAISGRPSRFTCEAMDVSRNRSARLLAMFARTN